ncbi:50S ribosomal protein L25/general stress protein Ctc [Cognatazoarcus halotolerans]|uniref:50S ribosomal protein L25/general stress protein Ctc n=1 Tax=Cognatazoarcus halotolerans TaxID=2686016 RepID=UPI00135CDE13|nr:50S ribosomal protein L25/general stress protein Ctc [Cognatazoarcus halotolerans]MBX3681045.1 50S ribosomal protein L25/general stress protein Ctc [Rhodocyclaceae bacterium]MCB1897767.1 50S ribosomal protein L25/general stress protein Ctc [Rhodocyclaceae bacterium]MCP5309745.1 50S ribosomal protein L25/general stress protein Ctc [Zoogloeaceae bacterium]
MQISFKAEKREAQGSGASRRLRRAGKLPGIIYGAGQNATPISLDHNELYHLLHKEAFHASVLNIDVEGEVQEVVLRDTQWHAYRAQVQHIDFQRIVRGQKMHMKVPLHFVNDEICPGVKLEGGMVSHVLAEVDVECLPKDLPEFIQVDLKDLATGNSIHLSELVLPAGVAVVHHGEGDPVVATVLKTGGGEAAATDEGGEAAA